MKSQAKMILTTFYVYSSVYMYPCLGLPPSLGVPLESYANFRKNPISAGVIILPEMDSKRVAVLSWTKS